MVIDENSVNNIIGGVENMGRVRLHNHKRKLKQRFDLIRKLGQGTYGKVQLGINKETGEEVAIKTIKKSKIETEADLIRIRREIQIMSSIQHPNIIHIYEVFENSDKIVLVMEYAAGGELYDYLSEKKILTEQEARRLFRQIVTAVYYCHKYQICHRDLKLENILLDEVANAKIADFGLSNVFSESNRLSTFCGSPLYASPEIVKGTPYRGPEVDCWSLGVLLYTLVYGAMPFDGSNFKTLVTQISRSHYFEPVNPSPASSLIKDMLTVCPTKRASIQSICAHEWLNEGYTENCLDIAKDFASQTPVRLDLLLSLATQIPKIDMLSSTNQQHSINKTNKMYTASPARSYSVDSLMDLNNSEANNKKDDAKSVKSLGAYAKKKSHTNLTTDRSIESANNHEEEIQKPNLPLPSTSSSGMVPETNNVALKNVGDTAQKEVLPDKIKLTANSVEKTSKSLAQKKVSPTEGVDTMEPKKHQKVHSTIKQDSVLPKYSRSSQSPQKEKKSPVEVKTTNIKNDNVDVRKNSSEITVNTSQSNVFRRSTSSSEKDVESEDKLANRRRSRIFETAEKFKQLSSSPDEKPNEKSKQIFIPGVSVEYAKKAYERKSSISSTDSSTSINRTKSKVSDLPPNKKATSNEVLSNIQKPSDKAVDKEEIKRKEEEKKQAINVITSILGKPPLRKSSASSTSSGSTNNSTSAMLMSSHTLPRRKITPLSTSVSIEKAFMNSRDKMDEKIIPRESKRASSLGEIRRNDIPVSVSSRTFTVKSNSESNEASSQSSIQSSAESLQQAGSTEVSVSSRQSLVRQLSPSKVLSASNSWNFANAISSKEPSETTKMISKSPKEFIIPIAVEGSGYILPKATAILTGAESRIPAMIDRAKLRRLKAFKSDSSDNENEASFSPFRRDSSGFFPQRMHSLRSTRSSRFAAEPADSLSSEDDDEGLQLLTAENLFSTLLSRVRSLTQRLNLNDSYKYRNSLFCNFDTPSPRSKISASHVGSDN